MARSRHQIVSFSPLVQGPATTDVVRALSERTFLTFAGDETYLLYIQGFPLREFCAFEVFDDAQAWRRMQDELLRPIADAAAANGMGLLAGCLVWRASADYLARLGGRDLAAVNRNAVERTRAFIDEWRAGSEAARATPVIITGDIGPRGDGYAVSGPVSVGAAYDYHAPQVEVLARAGVDVLLPLTMTSLPETVGIVRAAERAGLPVLVSPTIEPDGRLPDGTPLGELRRRGRPADVRHPGGLHGQLRSPEPPRPGPRRRRRAPARPGSPAFAACAPTHRPRRTPSWTTAPRWTAGIRRRSRAASAICSAITG